MELTRRSFITAAGAAATGLTISVPALADADTPDDTSADEAGPTQFVSGTYEATAEGRNGPLTVSVTFGEDAIKDVQVISHSESDDISYVPLTVIPRAIVAGQTVDVDVVSGASLTSGAILRAVADTVEQAGVNSDSLPPFDPASVEQHMTPGVYEGEAFGKWKAGNSMSVAFGGYEVTNPTRVRVEVDETSILSVEVLETSDTPGFCEIPCERTPRDIVEQQSVFCDVVSGCTLTSAAIEAAVVKALQQAGADLAGFAKATPHPEHPAETYEADLVIVGAGGTGTSCALRAVELGLKVVVIEKTARISGQSACAYGAFGVGSKLDEQVGNHVGVDEVVRNMMDYAYWKIDAALVRAIVGNSGRMIDWLQEKWNSCGQPGFNPPMNTEGTSIAHDFGNGTAKFQALWDTYLDGNVELLLNTRADRLVVEDGQVRGVHARKQDGTEVTVNAPCALVATGGFGGNKAMLEQYVGGSDYYLVGLSTNAGDGINMLLDAGGVLSPEASPQLAEFCSNDKIDFYAGSMKFVNQCGFLMVDGAGSRYMDESYCITYALARGATGMWRAGASYVVLTQADLDSMTTSGVWELLGKEYIEANQLRPVITVPSFPTMPDEMTQAIDAGQAWKADSLEELGHMAGFEDATWTDTLAQYQQAIANGADELFGKDPRLLHPLDQGPFYCVRIICPIFGSYNGVKINSRFQMLDKGGHVAPAGLFVGGSDESGVYSFPYTEYNGMTMCNALTGGMLIAENVAEYLGD